MTMTAPTGPQDVNSVPKDGDDTDDRPVVLRLAEAWRDAVAWLTPRLSWNRAALGLFILLAVVVVATFAGN